MDNMNEDVLKELEALLSEAGDEGLEDFDFSDLDNTIILTDENGEEVEFEFIDMIDYEGGEYVVLIPKEDIENENDDGEVFIMKVETDGENEIFSDVEDEVTATAVFEIFKEKFESELSDLLEE